MEHDETWDYSTALQKITSHGRTIREYINHPRIHYDLRKDTVRFNKVCSSLDVIEDTCDAIGTYPELAKGRTNHQLYLLLYGLLQAVYVQQDTIRFLSDCLEVPTSLKGDKQYQDIRQVRNLVGGHPVYSDQGPTKGQSHRINQSSLSPASFEVFSVDKRAQPVIRAFDLRKLLAAHLELVESVLLEISREVHQREQDHKAAFRGAKLEACFGQYLYALEKIGEYSYLSKWGIDHLESCLAAMKTKLEERGYGVGSLDSVDYYATRMTLALDRLQQALGRTPENEEDYGLFLDALGANLSHLIDILHEIDAEYDT